MQLQIVVPRKPVSVNQAYCRAGFSRNRGAGGGKGFILTSVGRDYKEAVRSYALIAARKSNWPKPEKVKSVTVEISVFNCRHDVGSPEKLTCDAMEGIVYANDRVIQKVSLSKQADETKRPRVEITVELVEGA